jgi:hypothetical protein
MPEASPAPRRFRSLRIGCVVLAGASFVGLLAIVLAGLEKVHAGHGLPSYRTTWLLEFNWVVFLVLSIVMMAALAVALFLGHRK